VIFGPSLKTTGGWGPLSVREGEGPGYRFGFLPGWAVDLIWSWADSLPLALLYFFLLLSSFSFSVSCLIHNLFKNTSIQIKLLPEIFKKTSHYSKSIIKQVFK
jgi:hypothetical protein